MTIIARNVNINTVIQSFVDKDTERVFKRLASKRLSVELQRAAYRKLLIIDAAEAIDDLKLPPGNRLEKLKHDRRGQYSIRINDQWRICFSWKDTDARDVEIVDYHS